MLFHPRWYHYPVILLLLPLSILYGSWMLFRRILAYKKDFGIPIVSIGNLIVGGSGKTPFVIALASRYSDVAVISRGYGRKSNGLVEVSRRGKILVSVEQSGDEAMLMALSLPNASVIVSEDRHEAIALAKGQGAKLIILDDGFNRVEIEKYEILLEPEEIKNPFPFPSGPFREFAFTKKYADLVLKEKRDFERVVSYGDPTSRMVLVTAISNPKRLERYLPTGVVGKVYLKDHAYFEKEMLERLMQKYEAQSLLVTQKDHVKMAGFKLPVSQIKLELKIKDEVFTKIERYIQTYHS
ncbi:tetraacyldisaccharide 4'-kinase [Sulfurovum lithotrophicum]|uniref:Tetraacyldisaccharide 4'-kinase n=2 Tax=Sulfurovum lithotrophicum TaxID=206403 RepID=A0A7U4M324_9BACT|nr:tetraacyldisaccharide 4'-kinase [Sulfurovum lithotrophicum]